MYDIFEKCIEITIRPKSMVDKQGNPAQIAINAKACRKDVDGTFSYAEFNINGKDFKEAESKLRRTIDNWHNI